MCRYWVPVLIWMGFIFIGSGDVLSSTHTSRFLEPLVRWLLPSLTREAVGEIVFAIRKCGHLTEYAILWLLCWRALRQPLKGDTRPWSWRDAEMALAFAAAYAVSDELHQAFVPSRQGSAWDVLLDTCGAAAGLLLVWGVGKVRRMW
jgi:VanZ family protein